MLSRLLISGMALLAGCGSSREFVVDGYVRGLEWRSARRFKLSPLGFLYLRREGDVLQIAVDGPVVGVASVLLHDGERIHVLHASAALGTAVFEQRSDGAWQATRHFRWQAGDPLDAEARASFRETHGWLANPIPRGPYVDWRQDREFSIDLARFGRGARLRVAAGVLHATGTGGQVERWPESVADDAASVPLHRGDTSRTYRFDPETWHVLDH